MEVEIPITPQHEGMPSALRTFNISDKCPKCGKKRGIERWRGFSYDGSRRLSVDLWKNECDHIDKYSDVVKEATQSISS